MHRVPDRRGDTALGFDELAIDPYIGREVYRGTLADLSEGLHQFMPFVFALHYELALGERGRWLLGIASVGGRGWQVALVLIGLATLLLSVTGVYLWWRKRMARLARAR